MDLNRYKDKTIFRSHDEIKKNTAKLFELRNKKYKSDCLHPERHNCNGQTIQSHSIQKAKILRKLAENNHVICPYVRHDADEGPQISFDLKGINEASTFDGFCNYHDTETFRLIETNSIDVNNFNHLFLYAYRAVVKQYHSKWIAYSLQVDSLKIFDPQDNFVRELMNKMVNSFRIGLEDFKKIKKIFDWCLLNNEFRQNIIYYVRILDYELPISINSVFTPTYDFKGNILNDYALNKTTNNVIVNIFPEDGKTYILFACLKKQSKTLNEYIDNYINYNNITDVVSEMIFRYIENFIIAPKYWNNLSTIKRNNIVDFWKDTLHRNPLLDMGIKYDPLKHNLINY